MKKLDWSRDFAEGPQVRGILHEPADATDAVVLAHGAGSDRDAKLLVAVAEALAARGMAALRVDLPYRQRRPKGPPSPSGAAADREGIRRAAASLREKRSGRIFLAGSSYGGRQASMLAADDAEVAAGLLLLSYPLHPPGKPERLRTEHWPRIQAPVFFAHGTKDAFGSIEELEAARELLTARSRLFVVEGASHGIVTAKTIGAEANRFAGELAEAFLDFV